MTCSTLATMTRTSTWTQKRSLAAPSPSRTPLWSQSVFFTSSSFCWPFLETWWWGWWSAWPSRPFLPLTSTSSTWRLRTSCWPSRCHSGPPLSQRAGCLGTPCARLSPSSRSSASTPVSSSWLASAWTATWWLWELWRCVRPTVRWSAGAFAWPCGLSERCCLCRGFSVPPSFPTTPVRWYVRRSMTRAAQTHGVW